MSRSDANHRIDAPAPPQAAPKPADIYEWEILIQAPFAFDFFKLVRSLFQLPKRRVHAEAVPHARKKYFLHVVLHNLARIGLILFMIPFTMLAFSYVATLPFLIMRALQHGIGAAATAALAAVGLLVSLFMPVAVILQWFRPGWLRESYKKSKVELYNIIMYAGLFLAAGMLETLIASPALPFHTDFAGPVESTPQWTLFFADLSMNVLFAHLPQKFFGSISDITVENPGRMPVALGLLRLLLIVGFVTLVRLLALKLCVNKSELFTGTRAEVKQYLPYCGRALARPIRKIIPLPLSPEEAEIREQFRYRPDNGTEPEEVAARPAAATCAANGEGPEDGSSKPICLEFATDIPTSYEIEESKPHE